MTRDPGPCHVLILHRDGEYQATCKPCHWESPSFGAISWARAAGNQHQGDKEQQEGTP